MNAGRLPMTDMPEPSQESSVEDTPLKPARIWSDQKFCVEAARGKVGGRPWAQLPKGQVVKLHRAEVKLAYRGRGKRWTGLRFAGPVPISISGPALIRESPHDYGDLMARRRKETRSRVLITLAHLVLGAALVGAILVQDMLGERDRMVLAGFAALSLATAATPLFLATFLAHRKCHRRKMKLGGLFIRKV
jgi:hypothetical protein